MGRPSTEKKNWRASGVRASIYIDALFRHVTKWQEGEECDPDSGLPHLAHALACLAIIVDAQMVGKLVDDREFNGMAYSKFVASLTPHVERLRKLHADKNPHHYTIADNLSDNIDELAIITQDIILK